MKAPARARPGADRRPRDHFRSEASKIETLFLSRFRWRRGGARLSESIAPPVGCHVFPGDGECSLGRLLPADAGEVHLVAAGDLEGSCDTRCRWGEQGGRVYTTALATLTLEVYYRYLPMYGGKTAGN